MEIAIYDFVGVLTFFLLYILIGVIVGRQVYGIIDNYRPRKDDESSIVLDKNIVTLSEFKGAIAVFIGLMWIISIPFLLAKDAGGEIHDSFINNGNEEDRIASWLF